MAHTDNMRAVYIIVNAGYADDVIEIARKAGAGGATILNARGEGSRHEVFMGVTVDSEKEIIICLVDEGTADRVMDAVKEKAGIKSPAHTISYSVPVRKVIGLSAPMPPAEGGLPLK